MLRPQDQAPFLALQERGTARILDIGYALDADMLWFNLSASGAADAPYRQTAFRQAVSAAIDRQAIADTVYLGAATPVAGPTTPGNTTWFAPDLPAPVHDPTRARMLLAGLGYRDRDGDGLLETADGRPVRFSLLAQAGHLRGGVATMIREQLRQVGIEVKLASLDSSGLQSRVGSGDYEAAYYGIDSSSPDPVMNQEFWLSRGQMHVWHPQQPTPATPWEARIDALMHEQATATSLPERQRAFAEVQRIMIEQAPAIFLVAPRIVTAVSSRVRHVAPAAQTPQLLWSADTLAVAR
jgi:peptide/nickel transport system substrate-binding protein